MTEQQCEVAALVVEKAVKALERVEELDQQGRGEYRAAVDIARQWESWGTQVDALLTVLPVVPAVGYVDTDGEQYELDNMPHPGQRKRLEELLAGCVREADVFAGAYRRAALKSATKSQLAIAALRRQLAEQDAQGGGDRV